MKSNKTAILYFIASISFFIGATINFFNSFNGIGVINIILGVTSLCLALEHSKVKNHNNDNKGDEG